MIMSPPVTPQVSSRATALRKRAKRALLPTPPCRFRVPHLSSQPPCLGHPHNPCAQRGWLPCPRCPHRHGTGGQLRKGDPAVSAVGVAPGCLRVLPSTRGPRGGPQAFLHKPALASGGGAGAWPQSPVSMWGGAGLRGPEASGSGGSHHSLLGRWGAQVSLRSAQDGECGHRCHLQAERPALAPCQGRWAAVPPHPGPAPNTGSVQR